jgi:tetratricopeptide (TPR) repeat protein
MKFVDFNLTIKPAADGWRVLFADSYGSAMDEHILPPPPQGEVEALRDRVERDAQTTALTALNAERALARGAFTEADEKLREVGETLFKWVFSGKVLQAFRDKHAQARREQNGLRIRLSIDPSDSSLGLYPFEIMFCPEVPFRDHLALFSGVTIVRSMTGCRFNSPATIKPPLRILVVGASPNGYPPLDIKREIENLEHSLNLPGIKIEVVENCSVERLKSIASIAHPHVLHFIGHGEFSTPVRDGNPRVPEGRIVFADKKNDPEPLTGEEFRREIAGISSLRLVTLNACLLNACQGADLFSSVAASIFSLQLPAAVVAMQFRITDLAAIEFSKSFYSQLALGRPVDDAITSARSHVRRKIKGTPEWATPVLYLGTPDGDFLGLRLPLDQLISHALEHLRDGNWDTAQSTATLALEQHPEADTSRARKIAVFADQSDQISETYAQVFRVIKRGGRGDDYPTNMIERLVQQATDFDEEELKRLLVGDLGKCAETIRMARAMEAFGRGEFDRVIELCEQAPSHDVFAFDLIKEQARAEQDALKEAKVLNEIWSSGDWNTAVAAVERLSLLAGPGLTRVQKEIEIKRAVGRELGRVLEALKRGDLKRAQSVMAEIPAAQAPSNFELSRRVIDLGVKALGTLESKDANLLAGLKYELDEMLSPSARGVPVETLCLERVQGCLSDISSEMDYQAGHEHSAKGLFTESLKCFARLAGYKDSADKAARCEKWVAIMEKLQSRQWDDAKRLLAALKAEDKSPRVLTYLHWCNWARVVIPILETMAASPVVYDPFIPWEGGDNPYKVFASQGVSPTSSMAQCSDLGFELRGMEERNAWDMLRLLSKRLLVDFLLYSVKDQGAARALADRLSTVEEGKELRIVTTQELVSELGEDGGIFLLLRKDYDQAISFFLQEAAARPYYAIALHHLGIAAASKIHWLEEQGGDIEQLAQAWEYVILAWAAVFANDNFWHNWWFTRRNIYNTPISSQEIHDARLQLQRLWLERIKSATDICAGLDTTFQAELNGALAVNTGGGIPLLEHAGEVAVTGFTGAKALGLLGAVAGWTSSFDAESLRTEGWQRWTCYYFSELAEPLALFQDSRYEEAVAVLASPRCDLLRRNDTQCQRAALGDINPPVASASCPCFEGANPAFARMPQGGELLLANAYDLLERAHYKIALAAVSSTPANNGEALEHWKIAVELARRRGDTEDLLARIRDVIIGRAHFLVSSLDMEDQRRCLNILDDVIELLDLSYHEKWDDEDKALRLALIDYLLVRATFLSNQLEEHEYARRDAIRAYSMEPEYLRAIHILCKVNWFYAWRLHDRGEKQGAEALLREVEERLKEGDQLFPDNPDLASCHKDLKEIYAYIAKVKGVNLEALINSTPLTTGASSEQQKLSKLAEASLNEAQKQFAEAVKLYDEILQSDPDSEEVQARMAYCYKAWIHYEWASENQSSDRISQLAREARERFPNSDLFSGYATAADEEEAP